MNNISEEISALHRHKIRLTALFEGFLIEKNSHIIYNFI